MTTNLTIIEFGDDALASVGDCALNVEAGFRALGLWRDPIWRTTEVEVFMASAGFDCDEKHIGYLIRSGQVPTPRRIGRQLGWTAADVARLILYCHEKRRWLPGRHMQRKTSEERQRDYAVAIQALRMVDHHLATASIAELESRLATAESGYGHREAIEMALALKYGERDAALATAAANN